MSRILYTLIVALFTMSLAFAQTPVELTDTFEVTASPAVCTGVTDCTGLQTEYIISNQNVTAGDGLGPEIIGSSISNMITLGDFTSEGGTYGVLPICYDITALQLLVDAINTNAFCCTNIDAIAAGFCDLIMTNFPAGSDVQDFDDVLFIVGLVNGGSASLQGFEQFIGLVNTNIGVVAIACPGSIAMNYCMDAENPELYSVPITSVDELEANGINNLQLAPNPMTNEMRISFDNTNLNTIQLSISDYTGKVISNNTIDILPGYNTINTNVADLAQGIYFVKLQNGQKQTVRKIVKL